MSDTKQKDSRIVTRRNICAFGSVAAAAVITVGSVAFYNAHKPSDLLADHSVIEQDNSHKDDGNPEHQGIYATTSSDKSEEHTTNNSAIASQTDKPQEDTKGTVTTPVKDTDAVESENAASKTDSQTQRPCDSSAPNTQQGTAQEHNQTDPPEDPTSANNYYQNFKATVDPYSDAYGEDELHLVSVIISGRYYYQLDTSEHPAHNISISSTPQNTLHTISQKLCLITILVSILEELLNYTNMTILPYILYLHKSRIFRELTYFTMLRRIVPLLSL